MRFLTLLAAAVLALGAVHVDAGLINIAGSRGAPPSSGSGDDGWTSASTAPGVIMATAFDTSAEVTDWTLINGTESRVSLDAGMNLGGGNPSGGALRFDVLDSDEAASGLWGRWLNNSTHHVFGNGETYYVRYSYRTDEAMWRYHPLQSLAFKSGSSIFTAGDTVSCASCTVVGTQGTVARVYLISGSWGAGTATGNLVLSSVTGTFEENKALTSGTGGAAVGSRWSFPTDVVSTAGGYKLSIFSWHSSSAATNEVVTQNTLDRGYFQMYNQDGNAFPPLRIGPFSTPCNGSNYRLQGGIDLTTPSSPSSCTQYANRYGPLYDYGSGSSAPTARDITTQGHPRSEAATAGVTITHGVWYTLLTQVSIGTLGTASTTIKQWIQRPGASGYTLVHDYSGVTLSTANGGHDYVFMLPYETGKQPGAKGADAVVWYDELIVSTSTIPARVQ